MKRLSLLLILGVIAISLLLPLNIPVQPIDVLANGTKVVLDNGVVATYLGKTPEGQNLWKAVIGSPQYLDDLETPIVARWEYDIEKKEWNACDNLFTATAKDAKVTVWYEGLKLSWQPDVFVGTKKQAVGTAQLLTNDTINQYYHGNTLQWNYGDIVRNVRIIEGALFEYYTIPNLPTGDVMVISHSEKDAGFVWTRPAIAWDSEGKPLDLTVDGDDLTLTLDAMEGATFPITIDPDTTFTGSASDNTLANSETDNEGAQKDWDDCREDYRCSGTGFGVFGNVAVAGKYTGGQWYAACHRIPLYFNTISLPNDCTIVNATLRLYGTGVLQDEMGTWHMVVQHNSTSTYPHDPPINTDFNYTYYSGNGGNISSDDMGTGYKELYFSPTGLTWINKAGTTKFILREEEHDINDTLISYGTDEYDANEWEFYFYEQGANFRPELIVYYQASGMPGITTNAATYVTATTARLNSYVDVDGGEACDVRFQYSTVSGGVGGAYENFTNYTEVDTVGIIAINGTDQIDFDAWCNESAYLYYDYGVDYFGDFVHLSEIYTSGDEAAHATLWMLANDLGDSYTLEATSKTYINNHLLWNAGFPTEMTLYLMEGYGGAAYSDTYQIDIDTWYFLTTTKAGVNLTCDIYPNASRVTPLDTLSLTLQADHKFRYIYGVATHNYSANIHLAPLVTRNFSLGLGGAWINTSWVNDAYVQGDSPYANIANLNVTTEYFFRAQIRNTQGIVNGSELAFNTTTMSAPNNLTTYPSSHSVSLAWIKGSGTYNTMIRYQVGAYPANVTSGTQVYNGTMSTTTHTGLSPGFTYYYSAWGEGGGNYTANNTSAMTTTYAGGAPGDVPGAAVVPSVWYGAPDHTRLSGVPFYGMVNDLADAYGMPPTNFWLVLMLFGASLMGLFVYRVSDSGTVGVIGGGVTLVALLAALGGLLWIVFAVGIIATGVFVQVRRA